MKIVAWSSCAALAVGLLVACPWGGAVRGAEEEAAEDRTIELPAFTLTAPETWTREKPRSRIVEHEFSATASEGDERGGRITMMHSGGSLEDNVARWRGQFTEIDAASPDEPEERTIAGQKVVVVDITGTFKDSPGPFAPGVDREGYRMLGAILMLEDGTFFVKFTGPQKTVTENEEAFGALLETLRPK